jgi:hypothetical protein
MITTDEDGVLVKNNYTKIDNNNDTKKRGRPRKYTKDEAYEKHLKH